MPNRRIDDHDDPGDSGTARSESRGSTAGDGGSDNPNSEAPKRLVIDLSASTDGKVLVPRLQFSSEELTVQFQKPEKERWCRSFFSDIKFKDAAPILTAIASVVIAALVLGYGNKFNKRQNDIKEKEVAAAIASQQTQNAIKMREDAAAEEEARARHADMLTTFYAGLVKENESQRALTLIRLATYGREAFPSLEMALGVTAPSLRENAAALVRDLLRQGINRKRLFKFLLESFKKPDPYLRWGILESFSDLKSDVLSAEEQQRLVATVVQNLDTRKACCPACGGVDQEVLLAAAFVLTTWPSAMSKDFLIEVAKNPSCVGKPRNQALEYLKALARQLPSECKSISDALHGLLETGIECP